MEWKNVLFAIVFYIHLIKVFQECPVKTVRINFMFLVSENGSKLVIKAIVLSVSLISFDLNILFPFQMF